MAAQLAPFKDMITAVQDELKVDQSFEFQLRLAASPDTMLAENGEAIVMQLLKGISVDVKLNLWKKLADVILKIVESGEIDASLLPILGGMAPAFLLKVNGNLDITVDEQMKKKILENPMAEPILMDA